MQHHESHTDRLLDLVADSDDPHAAFDHSDLAACSTCAELMPSYAEVGGALARAERQVAKSVLLATDVRDAPGEALVARLLGPRLRSGSIEDDAPSPPSKVPWLSLLGGIVASALLIQFFLYDPFSTPSEVYGASNLDGAEGFALIQPVGKVASWTGFAWQGTLPRGSWYTLHIGDMEGNLLHTSETIREHIWIPEALQSSAWPSHIRWEAHLHDPSGLHVDTAYAEAWLASPKSP